MNEFIGAYIFSSDLAMYLRLIIVYGPCHNRFAFWEQILNSTLLQVDNTILGGDVNISIGHAES